MRFKLGEIVVSKSVIVEPSTGDHPTFLLCSIGQELRIRRLFSKEEFPVYGKDSYEVQDITSEYGEFFIDEDELK